MRSEGREGTVPTAAWDHVELFVLRGKAEGRAW